MLASALLLLLGIASLAAPPLAAADDAPVTAQVASDVEQATPDTAPSPDTTSTGTPKSLVAAWLGVKLPDVDGKPIGELLAGARA